jgi:hypothetical protein
MTLPYGPRAEQEEPRHQAQVHAVDRQARANAHLGGGPCMLKPLETYVESAAAAVVSALETNV